MFNKKTSLRNIAKADYRKMMDYGKDFRADCQKLQQELKGIEIDFTLFLAGPCTICNECTAVKNEVCRFPDEAIPSLEAAGVDVVSLTKKYGLKYNNGSGTMTLIGLLVYNET